VLFRSLTEGVEKAADALSQQGVTGTRAALISWDLFK
jgi:hypothetical protein